MTCWRRLGSWGSDLEIVCAKGAVVIMEADLLDSLPDELRQLFDDLGINPETVRKSKKQEVFMSNSKPVYKVMDEKGRILIPKQLRAATGMNHGDIIKLTVQKVVAAKRLTSLKWDQSRKRWRLMFSAVKTMESKPSSPGGAAHLPSSKKLPGSKDYCYGTEPRSETMTLAL